MLKSVFKNKELKKKVFITIIVLIFVEFLTNIPAPGINKEMLSQFYSSDIGQSLGFMTLFSGNSLSKMSMFILGISPFITASIILQLFRVAFPRLDEMAKDGKQGEEKYKRINYMLGGVFSILQSIPVAHSFKKSGILADDSIRCIITVCISLIIGSLIFMFLGSIIDKFGLKNGISLILMVNIISRIPKDVKVIFEMYSVNNFARGILAVIIAFIIFSFLSIWTIFLQDGEKRIATQYSGRVSNQKIQGKNTSYIPIKVNVAGVMPVIFTMNIFQIYSLIINLLDIEKKSIAFEIARAFNTKYWFNKENMIYSVGIILYAALLIFFQYFYSIIQFDTEKISKDLKKNGGVVVGIRPGKSTQEFLDKKLKSITAVGSILLFVVAVIPVLIFAFFNLQSLSLGGTSIIIIVGVMNQVYKEIESECLQNTQNSSFLSKPPEEDPDFKNR